MRCDQCTYWEAPTPHDWDAVRSVMGKCSHTPHIEDMTEWGGEEETTRVLKPEYSDRSAATYDASGYSSGLRCKPDHFCAMFKAKP